MPRKIAPWCIACANCETVCPASAVAPDPIGTIFCIAPERCNDCADQAHIVCERSCPVEAIFPAPRRKRLFPH